VSVEQVAREGCLAAAPKQVAVDIVAVGQLDTGSLDHMTLTRIDAAGAGPAEPSAGSPGVDFPEILAVAFAEAFAVASAVAFAGAFAVGARTVTVPSSGDATLAVHIEVAATDVGR
jgi:hypothetical protein